MQRAWARMLLLLAVPLCAVGPSLWGTRSFAPLAAAAVEPLASEDPRAAAAALAGANYLAVDALFPIASDRAVLRERMLRGELPLWEHRLGLGLPLLGNTLAAPFYPLSLVTLPWAPGRASGVHAFLSLFLAGLGLWLLLERLGLCFGAAAAGALALQSGGWGLANLPLAPKLDAALWLPWMLWAIEGWFACRRRSAWALAGASAASFLAGFPPIAVFGLCAALAYIGVRARALRVPLACALGAVLLCLCGVGLAAPQLALNLDASLQSPRGRQDAASLEAQALPSETLLTLVAPQLFGSPLAPLAAARDPLTWWLLDADDAQRAQQANALEWDLWIGMGALALAAAALAATPRRAWFPAALALCAMGFAQGWPPVALLYHVPGLDLGAPARAAALLWVAAAWLCGLGAEALLARAPRALAACAATLAAGLCAALVWLLRFDPELWAAAVPAQLAARFGVDAKTVAETVDLAALPQGAVRLGRAATGVLSAGMLLLSALAITLRADSARLRAAALTVGLCAPGLLQRWTHLVPRHMPHADSQWPASGALQALARAAGDGRVLRFDASASGIDDVLALARPNLPQVYGIADLTPYVVFPGARTVELLAALDPQSRYRGGVSRLSDLAYLDHPILDLLRVTALLSRRPLEHARLEPVFAREGFHVYRRLGVPALARVVPMALASSDDGQVLTRLVAREVGPLDACVLAPGTSAQPAPALSEHWRPGELSVRRPLPEVLEVDVRDSSGGWLVLSEAWAPGWQARLDGQPVEVLRADHALRAVRLPPGEHRLRMLYAPRAWDLGLLVGALALVLTGLLARARAPRG